MASTFLSPHSMPDVFVVPPEEDQSPTWCYFNASDPPPLHLLSSASPTKSQGLLNVDSPRLFSLHDQTITPVPPSNALPVSNALMDGDPHGPDSGMDADRDPQDRVGSTVGNDSEIVEVVKFRRRRQGHELHTQVMSPPMKRSKSFKFRASKVLRSMKIVSKGSIRSKDYLSSLPPTTEEDLPPRSKTPAVSRRGSAVFFQLFSPSTVLQPPSPVSSFGVSRNSADFIQSETVPFSSPSSPPYIPRPPSPSHSSSQDVEYQGVRGPSPSPSMSTFSNKRRFSMMGLQRLFSFSPGMEAFVPTQVGPCMSRNSSGPSTVCSLGPDTPTEEQVPLPHLLHLDREGVDKRNSHVEVPRAMPVPVVESGEISFEMRLDSLHFDGLSFDVDRF